MPEHETLSIIPMTRELCHEFYRGFARDPATYMDMSLFEPFVYDPEWVDRYFDRQQRPDRVAFLLFRDLRPIGEVILKEIDQNKKECVLSIHMQNDSVKGKGYGTKAILMAYGWARDVLGMQAVKADAVLKNTRSQHILKKLGFRLVSEDGTFKYYQRP